MIPNRRQEQLTRDAIVAAQGISDDHVVLPAASTAEPALVTSCEKSEEFYMVYSAAERVGGCTCKFGLKGNLCKHQVEFLVSSSKEFANFQKKPIPQ